MCGLLSSELFVLLVCYGASFGCSGTTGREGPGFGGGGTEGLYDEVINVELQTAVSADGMIRHHLSCIHWLV